MSTYYHFACDKCKKRGGFLSSQMWGWGNFDIVASFRFMAKHAYCGDGSVRMHSEYNNETSALPTDDLSADGDVFPNSNDWDFVQKNWTKGVTRKEICEKWLKEQER